MPTLSISVTDDLAEMVSRKVTSGLYGDASEVVRDALQLMRDRDHGQDAEIAYVKGKISRGLRQAEGGEFTSQSVADIVAEARSLSGS